MTAALRLFDDSEKRKRENWLADFGDAWLQVYGGIMNFGIAARYLKPLVGLHGHAKVLKHFRHYLTQTEARFVSMARFAETFGAWNPAEQNRKPCRFTNEKILHKLRNVQPPLNWGPYWLQKVFADRGLDGMSLDELDLLCEAWRKEQPR